RLRHVLRRDLPRLGPRRSGGAPGDGARAAAGRAAPPARPCPQAAVGRPRRRGAIAASLHAGRGALPPPRPGTRGPARDLLQHFSLPPHPAAARPRPPDRTHGQRRGLPARAPRMVVPPAAPAGGRPRAPGLLVSTGDERPRPRAKAGLTDARVQSARDGSAVVSDERERLADELRRIRDGVRQRALLADD